MLTSAVFLNAGYPERATAISRGGSLWLRRHIAHVQAWADGVGLDISESLLVDLGEVDLSPPDQPFRVDVIVPFSPADAKFVGQCLESLAAQKHVSLVVHLVEDSSQSYEYASAELFGLDVRYHVTGGRRGPYWIANAVAEHTETGLIALNDVDDVRYPDCLWRQCRLLQLHNAEMVSSALRNYCVAGDVVAERRVEREPVVLPGRVQSHAPLGACVNPTRLMTTDLFVRMNGFADEICSMDFEFDTRCRAIGVRVIDDTEVMGDRFVRGDSLSHGGDFGIGTDLRARANAVCMEIVEAILDEPTLLRANLLGNMSNCRLAPRR